MPYHRKKPGSAQSVQQTAKQSQPQPQNQSPLPWVERYFYFGVTVTTVAYIVYSVYRDSNKYDGILNVYDFAPGWGWVGREQDISNFEWHYWYAMFWRLTPWYVGHYAVARIVDWNFSQHRKGAFLVYSVFVLCQVVGWKPVALLTVHSAIMYLVSSLAHPILVWVVSLALLSTLNFEPFVSLMQGLVEEDEEQSLFYLLMFTLALTNIPQGLVEEDEEQSWFYLLMFTLALTNIRSTSFCLERCSNLKPASTATLPHITETEADSYRELAADQGSSSTGSESNQQGTKLEYSMFDMFFYLFYLPLFFTGPILTFDLFKEQMSAPPAKLTTEKKIFQFLNICRFVFWAFFCELLLHFLYFPSLQKNAVVLGSVPLFTLAGLGYCHGQFFMLKYHVMFGYPASIARLDGMDPPQGPKCISYIHLYSEMWKYFDRGLYSFLKKYIFIPCGGSRQGLHRQIIASLICFMYIFYWHGAEFFILMWIILNYIGITLEKMGNVIGNLRPVRHLEENVLSATMVQRVHGFCSIPVFLVSCFSMFCFFGDHTTGYKFFQRLILEGWLSSYVTLTFLVYCAIQNGIEVNRWTKNRQQKAKKS